MGSENYGRYQPSRSTPRKAVANGAFHQQSGWPAGQAVMGDHSQEIRLEEVGVEDPEAVEHFRETPSHRALGIEDWLRGWRDLDLPSLMTYRGHWVNARRSTRGQVA